MRLLLIRHGDPDYEHDCLTARGRQEAAALAECLCRQKIDYFYVSPLGRAQETARYTLRAMDRTAETLEWLREFPAQVDINGVPALQDAYPDTPKNADGSFRRRIAWDMLPRICCEQEIYRTENGWRQSLVAQHSDMEAVYDRVCAGLDELLSRHGYVPENGCLRAQRANDDTVACFCHFGMISVILSRLWGVSPFVPWHNTVVLPTGVTELYTEEREEGLAHFRCTRLGDCGHLYAAGIEPAFSGRYCERFTDDTLH
ncbi:MAG: histidine phosphatase family protein [Oscillospiraceae bacterium]|nr:histidine phosphatase family protein [Oscillospiraceae bacterium]